MAWVYLPAAVAIQFGFAAVLTMPALLHSAVKPWGDGSIWAAAGLLHLVVNGGAGLHFGLAGLMCLTVAMYVARAQGDPRTVLGLKWTESEKGERDWRRFVWAAATMISHAAVVLGAYAAIAFFFFVGLALGSLHVSPLPDHFPLPPTDFLEAPVLLLLILVAIGKDWRQTLRTSVRLPYPEHAVLAFLLPVCVYHLSNFAFAVYSGSEFGTDSQMWRGSLSHLLFILLPLALAEEIGWRGYLLPKLIAKFGRFWGIFWVSIVWAAFHFSGDLGSNQSDSSALRTLVVRIAGGIAIGFFLSWLTLRSRSVVPRQSRTRRSTG